MKYYFLVFTFLFSGLTCLGQKLIDRFPETDGIINTMERKGDTLFIGGTFSRVFDGYNSGKFGTAFDRTNWGIKAEWARPNAEVHCVIPDGSGGFYIGGAFTKVGDSARAGIAHLDSFGRVTQKFSGITVSGYVKAFTLKNDTLYFGGSFTSVNTQSRYNLASINITSNTLINWNPYANNTVKVLTHFANTLYIAGDFDTIAGQYRKNLASITIPLGTVTSWNPLPSSEVKAILPLNSRVFVAGDFVSVGGQSRKYVASLDPQSGAANSWSIDLGNYKFVNCLALLGSRLLLYSNVKTGPTYQDGFAYIDTNSGSFSFKQQNNLNITSMYAVGSKVYVTGAYTPIASIYEKIGVLDTSIGYVNWSVSMVSTLAIGGSAYCIAASATTVYSGGYFPLLGGVSRNCIAGIDLTTGKVINWNPGLSDTVSFNSHIATMRVAGNRLYVGGKFTSISGQVRGNAASFDLTTGNLTSWNPNADNNVTYIEPFNNKIYLAGKFYTVKGQNRYTLACVDTITGNPNNWRPDSSGTAGNVMTMVGKDSLIYIGGTMTYMNGKNRNSLLAIDANSGVIRNWTANVGGSVYTICIAGSTMYIGGYFTTVGGQSRNIVAAVDVVSGSVKSWGVSSLGGNTDIYKIINVDSLLYVVGNFMFLGGESRKLIASLDTITGNPTTWNPNYPGDNFTNTVIHSIVVYKNMAYVGGAFYSLGKESANYLGAFALHDSVAGSLTMNPTGLTNSYCGGQNIQASFTFSPDAFTGNNFILQLSDMNGSFQIPLHIGTTPGIRSGVVTGIIPANVIPGSNYRVRVVSTNPYLVSNQNGFPITINPTAKTEFFINNQTQCLNANNFIFTDTSNISIGTYTRKWYTNTGDTSSLPVFSKSFISAATYSIKLVSTSNLGCTDSVIQVVTVNPMPNAGFTLNKTAQCLNGNAFQLNDTSKIATGTLTRIWHFGNGDTSTLKTLSKSYPVAGTYTIKLKSISNINGCFDSLSRVVSVYAMPKLKYTLLSDSTQCFNENSFVFSDSSTIDSGSLTRTWYFGDGNISGNSPVMHSYNIPKSYTIKLKVVSDKGCMDSISKNIMVKPNPSTSAITGNTFVQAGSIQTYGVSNTPGSLYSWFITNGSIISGSTTNSISVQWNQSGHDTVKVIETGSSGCKGDTMKLYVNIIQDSLEISTDTLSVSPASGTYSLQLNSNVNWVVSNPSSWLTVSPMNGSGDTTLTIDISTNTGVERAQNISITAGALIRNLLIIQTATVGTYENAAINGTLLYPNPSFGRFVLHNGYSENVNAQIIDMTGKLVETLIIIPYSDLEYNASSLTDGLYTIQLTRKDSIQNMRLIIAK